MFSGFMVNAWIVATMVAVVAGIVGFFTVLRGSAFVAHAVPQAGFAGAAGASLIGVSTLAGLGTFAVISALSIGFLGKRGRHDAVTALALVFMLGLGALFLSWSEEYASAIYALCITAVVILYRPLLLTSVVPEVAEARGVRAHRMEMCFLVVVALVTTMSVPVVGALLMFSLMVGAPGAARSFAAKPLSALSLSVGISVTVVWIAIAASYETDWPVGFFVGVLGAVFFIAGRGWVAWRRSGAGRVDSAGHLATRPVQLASATGMSGEPT
jgi:zinc/manganese transport system permease protein